MDFSMSGSRTNGSTEAAEKMSGKTCKNCQCGTGKPPRKLLPYAGGKAKLGARLAALIPPHRCYGEVFAGGAGLLSVKPVGPCEVINDVDGRLVTLYRVARYHAEELQREISLVLRSRQEYDDFRRQPGLTDIQWAARYLFCLLNTFGNSSQFQSFGTSTTRSLRWYPASVGVVIEWLDRRLERVAIENLDFADFLARYDGTETFFYLAPPYWIVAAPYEHCMTAADHQRLFAALQAVKGKWLLSYNDCPEVRALYHGFKVTTADVRYSICRNKAVGTAGRELLIRNY
jgi:DNA adenine methylase